MTTLEQVVTRTGQKLNVGRRDTLNKLATTINSSTTTVTLTYDIAGVSPGARVSIGLEDMHVWETTATSKQLTVERALGGSTAAAHTSGDLVQVNPTYTAFEILTAVNEVLELLPGWGVYHFKTVDLTSDASTVGYDLTSVTDLLRVHSVRYRSLGTDENWPVVQKSLWSVQQKAATSQFASAEALFIRGTMDPGRTVRVLYQAPFTALAALSDNVETVAGLPADAHSLLSIGAAYRLTLGRPIARSSMHAQGDTRRPEEVSTSDTRTAAAGLFGEWVAAIEAAKDNQTRRYGL